MSSTEHAKVRNPLRRFLGCLGGVALASGVLAALLVPAVNKARRSAQVAQLT